MEGCGGIMLADTEKWRHPLCIAHFEMFGEPRQEPNWEGLQLACIHYGRPRMFRYTNTEAQKA
jgi:hypothetical protein